MPEGRKAIPAATRRAVMEEAGYRCAVPTCKGTAALEIAHIEPWARTQDHSFANLIVLCAVDHHRFDSGEIPRQSIEAFKANLALLRGRYSDAERRILEAFALETHRPLTEIGFPIMGGTGYTMLYLVRDGLARVQPIGGVFISGLPAQEAVFLTEKGVATVERMRTALEVDDAV